MVSLMLIPSFGQGVTLFFNLFQESQVRGGFLFEAPHISYLNNLSSLISPHWEDLVIGEFLSPRQVVLGGKVAPPARSDLFPSLFVEIYMLSPAYSLCSSIIPSNWSCCLQVIKYGLRSHFKVTSKLVILSHNFWMVLSLARWISVLAVSPNMYWISVVDLVNSLTKALSLL